jgi:hypothetical protein
VSAAKTQGVWSARARITDQAALNKLTECLPAEVIAAVRRLATPAERNKAAVRYSGELKRAFWLQHDAEGVLTCITFDTIVSLEQAAELWDAIEQAPATLRFDEICDFYSLITGKVSERIGASS